ncbi:Putative Flp pilus-assembly TadE/G-like [Citreimonas salinaria]|uniref:Putative Flp pilus-assembly TadE/G-like n=2 Tax=Citreimonas salinaria TaxID=321339 RepID=A0A1H3JKN9_9RHOB|nr:Putative Flp pilus-assembly TadE/G-like [Citreimonas salinaria]
MTIFSALFIVLLLGITGASVDIMRQEAVRSSMQGTIDRAVLAAADLEQNRPPVAVVEDYVARAGMSDALSDVIVDEGLNYRVVTASSARSLDTFFLRLSGFDQLLAPARATAEEKVANVEIALVLDVSGSMGNYDRIGNLRDAARAFVDTVIQPEGAPGLTTVSVVPYSATVNIGTGLAPYFNLEETHDYSHCVAFDAADFDETAVDPAATLRRLGHFDPYSTYENATAISNPWCPTAETSAIIIHSADSVLLRERIGALSAGGNTATDLGMKLGVALLDPAMRPVVQQLAAAGMVPATANARPAEYDDREALKFVVVMTDGDNTSQYDLKPHYRTGFSELWIDDRGNTYASDDRFSLRVRDWSGSSNDVWFQERYESDAQRRYANQPDGGTGARRMTHAEVFARFGSRAVARRFMTQPYYDGYVSYSQYYDMYYAAEATVGAAEADNRLSRICAAARARGMVVFAIGFEAPARGQEAMRDCASSAAHYFDVEGVEIADTFHAIARQINSLRLTE